MRVRVGVALLLAGGQQRALLLRREVGSLTWLGLG